METTTSRGWLSALLRRAADLLDDPVAARLAHFATLATLLVLPAVFAILQARAHRRSASLDPDDPENLKTASTKPA